MRSKPKAKSSLTSRVFPVPAPIQSTGSPNGNFVTFCSKTDGKFRVKPGGKTPMTPKHSMNCWKISVIAIAQPSQSFKEKGMRLKRFVLFGAIIASVSFGGLSALRTSAARTTLQNSIFDGMSQAAISAQTPPEQNRPFLVDRKSQRRMA